LGVGAAGLVALRTLFAESFDVNYLDRRAREGGWGALMAVILLAFAIVVICPLII